MTNQIYNRVSFDLDKSLNEDIVINCTTKEDSNDLLEFLDSLGIVWCLNNINLLDYDVYDSWKFKEKFTCYKISIRDKKIVLSHGNTWYYIDLDFEIYKWDVNINKLAYR